MKIDFSRVLVDFRTSKPMTVVNGSDEERPLTLGFCCSEALLFPDQSERDPGAKSAQIALAAKVFHGGEIDVTLPEALLMQTKLAIAYPSPLVSGQCSELLNG